MPYSDLREFIAKLEEEGELKRIKAEVDWNLELCTVAKLNEEERGPALLSQPHPARGLPAYPSQSRTISRWPVST